MILAVLAGLWLVSPIVLLIALVVSRHQLAGARRRLAEWERLGRAQEVTASPIGPIPLAPAVAVAEAVPSPVAELGIHPQGPARPEPCVPDDSPVFAKDAVKAPEVVVQPPQWQADEPIVLAPAVVVADLHLEPPAFTEGATKAPASPHPTPEPGFFPVGAGQGAGTPAPQWSEAGLAADDWQPMPPGPLERALQAVSGWPRLIAPFLAQNIGWFIGGFCFVAGALFLVANTSGFLNALVVWGSLVGATAFLIWAGYQFRRQRPELVMAARVLLTLGLMLGPLDLAVAVRLFDASGGAVLPLAISTVLAVLSWAAFAWIARLTSALVERALSVRYAGLLTALVGLQLAAPLATRLPDWRALTVLHGVLLALLGEGLRRFAREGLPQVFVDRRQASLFAAGMLVYAATVSFMHLTWVWPESLPTGYAGPLLMAVCLLLFPVDAAFKQWVHQYAFLSRFSFALYGLSIVAIAIAAPSTPTALVTLTLGAGLYGWMTWQYLSLPPLYLLFGCVAGLYGYGILQWLPSAWHLLASVPGLLALLALGYRVGVRSPAIARQCALTFGVLLVGLTGWSLFSTPPSLVGFSSAATAALLGYGATRWMRLLPETDPRWAWGEIWVAGLAAVAVAWAPDWTALSWVIQTAFGWLALAALWSGLGVHDRQSPSGRASLWIIGALVMIAAALALVGANVRFGGFGLWEALVLVVAGALLLWLSLGLRQRSLFYGVLAVAAALGTLIKNRYFPGVGTGWVEFALVLGLWALLWWLSVCQRPKSCPEPTLAKEVGRKSIDEVIRVPLEQAMVLLWLAGLVKFGLRLLDGTPGLMWPLSAGLGAVSAVLLIGHFHWFRWAVLPMLLGLAGLLVELAHRGGGLPSLGTASGCYALLVWRGGIAILDHPLTGRLARVLRFTVPGGAGGRGQIERSLHVGALLIASVSVAVSPLWLLLGQKTMALWPMLGASLLVFVLTGWRYRTEIHAWLALITLTLGLGLIGGWRLDAAWLLGQPMVQALWSLGMALAATVLEAGWATALAWWRRPLWIFSGVLYGLVLAGVLVLGIGSLAAALAGLALYLGLLLHHIARPGLAEAALAALIASSLLALVDPLGVPLHWLPLALVFWHGGLLAIGHYFPQLPKVWQSALRRGSGGLPVVCMALLFLVADAFGDVWSVTLLALAVTTLLLGRWQDAALWQRVGLWLALTGAYTLWQWNGRLTWEALISLSPWYALQSALLPLLLLPLLAWLGQPATNTRDPQIEAEHPRYRLTLEAVISETRLWLLLATGLFLALHLGAVWAKVLGWSGDWPWYFGRVLDALAGVATLALLTGWNAWQAWRRPHESHRIYVIAVLLAALLSDARLLVWGLMPLTPWDTTVLLAAAGVAFLLHQWSGARPWYRLALLLPLLALLTVPWQLASPWAGGTLLTTGLLYLSLAGRLRNPLPLYLGMLALNGAVYLWAPLWAGRAGLWQLYLIPGAVSVLVLLHLHRRELRPTVLNGARLATLSVLYASAGLDVFLQPALWVFVLALALALAGILIGIALRIRAFLYTGVAFLVLNVGGQLLQFYPDRGISRALILLGLGAVITGGMVLFNLKREAILQRIRIMRADLAAWE